MPTFKFTSPEGKAYTIKGPEGATQEQAFAILQQQLGAAPAAAAPNPQLAGVPGYDAQGRPEAARAPVKEERPTNGVDVAMGRKGLAGDVFDKVLGVVETPVTMATGIAGGLAGAVAGLGKAAAKKITTGKGSSDAEVNKTVEDVANSMTYQPRTQTGAKLSQLIGQAAQDSGVGGLALPELNAMANAAGNATRAVRGAAAATAATQNAADAAAVAAKGPSLRDLVRAPSQLSGVGAAEAAQATTRAMRAQALPAPIKLTRGQLTRDRTQVAFERETAKQKEGAPLATHYEDQNATFGQNLDAYAEETGAQNYTPRAVGKSVVSALEAKDAAKKAEIRDLYQQARTAGEMQNAVDVSGLADWVAKNKGKDKLAPIVTAIENELKQNAKVEGGGLDNLTLTPKPKRTVMTLDASEDLRQAINKLAEPGTPNVVFGKEAKALIDAAQEGKGGDLFKQARRAYENYSNEFTNRDVIDKALRTKPGTKDRAVAYEDVFNHSIMNGSTDDVRHVFRVLEAHPVGTDPAVVAAGQQAAKDLRGAVINHIKDEMQKNLNVDSTGARTGSPAKIDAIVRELDKDGKLDVIFGKKHADQVRDLRDVAIDIYTSPTGTVNSSNTASALMRKLDDIAAYAKGTPIIGKAVNYSAQAIKSANTRRKVRDAINPNLKDLAGKGGK
jgi:hypothetical protein